MPKNKKTAEDTIDVSTLRPVKDSVVAHFLLKHNAAQAKEFSKHAMWRTHYRAEHPTEIIALKCMDGRLNLAIMTETPPGIIQPYRSLGGNFDIGWPYFGSLLHRNVLDAINQGRKVIIFVTYHWSRGDKNRGCKGFNLDTEAAKAFTKKLKGDIEEVFGSRAVVYPIKVGLETDEDALVIHAADGSALDFGLEKKIWSESELTEKLKKMFPDMPADMIRDLIPLLVGNQHHITEIRQSARKPIDLEHAEQVIGFGRGFDWLHLPNKALLIGPYAYNLAHSIATAAHILDDNLKHHRIPKEEGIVLMVSALYHADVPAERQMAIYKCTSSAKFALGVIQKEHPDLIKHFTLLTGILDTTTRKFTQIEV